MKSTRCRQLGVAYKRLFKIDIVYCWTIAALALLEDIANGSIMKESVFKDHTDSLAQDIDWLMKPVQMAKSEHFGALCWTAPGFGEGDYEESCLASANSSPHHAWGSL